MIRRAAAAGSAILLVLALTGCDSTPGGYSPMFSGWGWGGWSTGFYHHDTTIINNHTNVQQVVPGKPAPPAKAPAAPPKPPAPAKPPATKSK